MLRGQTPGVEVLHFLRQVQGGDDFEHGQIAASRGIAEAGTAGVPFALRIQFRQVAGPIGLTAGGSRPPVPVIGELFCFQANVFRRPGRTLLQRPIAQRLRQLPVGRQASPSRVRSFGRIFGRWGNRIGRGTRFGIACDASKLYSFPFLSLPFPLHAYFTRQDASLTRAGILLCDSRLLTY